MINIIHTVNFYRNFNYSWSNIHKSIYFSFYYSKNLFENIDVSEPKLN